ncbi:MFS transporter [Pseudoclavibacter chungangensis]|uniref:MFS transporter n=1 Tax=Pseudoclavibacter chungangensis TaxID=587635 RepID=A0A7J5C0H5_9MICO|nr:MFS transporter [Pseudoclavibacter chungangensis]KAB1660390.1 MFS transporter [Pseudoclavibacter chungangensis]NYJ65755.1 MFS family permease [Pseudoclavibacter chungangensis]
MSVIQEKPTSLVGEAGAGYFPIALVARLPFSMMVVGVLTLVVAGRESIALGGLNSAMVGLGSALAGPFLGMAADRFGQRPVMLVAGIGNSLALLAMALVVYSPLPDAAVLATAFFVGATAPQVSPMSRSRLVGIITSRLPASRRARVLDGTMAYESAADEIVFVFGPVLVGLLATTLSPAAPVIGASVLTLFFVTAFALHPTARTANRANAAAPRPAPLVELLRPRLLVLFVGVFGVGVFFGTTLTSLTSFMTELGEPEQAGLLYGVMGIGSAALALAAALFPPRFTMRARWLVFAVFLVIGAVVAVGARSVPVMLLALAIMGIGVGPTLVTAFGLVAARTPRGRSATGMTIAGAAIIVGQSAAAAVVGIVAGSMGWTAALWSPLVAAAIVALAGVVNWFLRRGER